MSIELISVQQLPTISESLDTFNLDECAFCNAPQPHAFDKIKELYETTIN